MMNDWQKVIVVPMDSAPPKIRIRTRQVEQLLGCRIQVVIDGWSRNSRYPSGHYVAAILLSHQILHDNSAAAVLECLPPEDYQSPLRLLILPGAQALTTLSISVR
jgi:exosome complex exonuclease DIS3/RRP44